MKTFKEYITEIGGMSYGDVMDPGRRYAPDAGKYREWIVQQFGDVLTHGGTSGKTKDTADRHVKNLSKLLNTSSKKVLKDIQKDYKRSQ